MCIIDAGGSVGCVEGGTVNCRVGLSTMTSTITNTIATNIIVSSAGFNGNVTAIDGKIRSGNNPRLAHLWLHRALLSLNVDALGGSLWLSGADLQLRKLYVTLSGP